MSKKAKTRKPQDVFTIPVCIPSKDGTASINTMQMIATMQFKSLGHFNFPVVSGMHSTIPRARNLCMQGAKKLFPEGQKMLPILWIDNDMEIPPAKVTDMLAIAEFVKGIGSESNSVITVNYRTTVGSNTYQLLAYRTLEENNELFMPTNVQLIERMGKKGASGFGCLAGNFPADYVFKSNELGEDILYFNEVNPDLYVYNGFIAGHRKSFILQ